MKAVNLIILTLSLFTVSVLSAPASKAQGNTGKNTVESHMANIRDRVRACAILPYHYQNNNRVDHAILSHCPEVRVIPVEHGMPEAKIKVGGHQFMATLIETQFSDGDVFDVRIIDLNTKDTYVLSNVLAFGDILLGVLGGSTNGVPAALATQSIVNN